MTASLYAMRLGELFRGLSVHDRTPGRLWRLLEDDVAPDNDSVVPSEVVAVPSEDVLVLAVDLPLPSRKRRAEALPFAVEDDIGDSLDAVHLALGAPIAPTRYLAGVVRHDVMRRWLAVCEDAGLERAALVPDALLLPRPAEGCWTIRTRGTRSLVRCADGTGFAIATAQLTVAWAAAGKPACFGLGDPLPDELAMLAGTAALMDANMPGLPLDLRQGRYALPRGTLPNVARRMLVATAAGVIAHGGIAMADTAALSGIAGQKQQDARVIAASVLPGIAPDADLIAVAAARLPGGAGPKPPGRFLPLLGRTSSALASAGAVPVQGMAYDDARALLTIDVAPENQVQVTRLLSAAGLHVIQRPGRVVVDGHSE